MIVRLLAASWAALAIASFSTSILALQSSARGRVERLQSQTALLSRIGRYGSLLALVLGVAAFRAFFTADLRTSLWPYTVAPWVALSLQAMWLRPYINAFVDMIERNFHRPVARFLVGHAVLDAIAAASLIILTWKGVR
ncbi:MAG: hypothetical protein ACI81L_002131 [Verrucomicrobiales bacterium]|jgi:hypothetical protein